MTALQMIGRERVRQIVDLGYTPEKDDRKINGELAMSASHYQEFEIASCSLAAANHDLWLKLRTQDKETTPSKISRMVKACALLVAEIERLQRLPRPIDGLTFSEWFSELSGVMEINFDMEICRDYFEAGRSDFRQIAAELEAVLYEVSE